MKIGIIGYDLFGTGGTTRSNINLINELLSNGHYINYFNLQTVSSEGRKKVEALLVSKERISFDLIENFSNASSMDVYIITRESLFIFARIIKKHHPQAKVIGEVHTPLALIDPTLDFASEAIDTYRVGLKSVYEKLSKKYPNNNIVHFPVSIRHLLMKKEMMIYPVHKQISFYVYSRFDEAQKNIAYAIKLIDYFVNHKKLRYHLYINGTGPSKDVYEKLVRLYQLQDFVFINQEVPVDAIYLSTARYETLGYSILEAFVEGKQMILYQGDDNSLREIYGSFKSFCWLTGSTISDAVIIEKFLQQPIEEKNRLAQNDFNMLNTISPLEEYGRLYTENVLSLPALSSLDNSVDENEVMRKIFSQNNFSSKRTLAIIYQRLKKVPLIKYVVNSQKFKQVLRKILTRNKPIINSSTTETRPREDFVFVESFHGKTFAGDPKYLSLYLKSISDKFFFVSSANELVDQEIYSYGMIPIRLGSKEYIEKFRLSKLVIINGNSLDKAGKTKEQLFIETWHGFPLKKIVADLRNEQQRERETKAFIPRMKKWDYLSVSSQLNLEIFKGAFKLSENPNLHILKDGSPRNTYLIENTNNVNEKQRLMEKYFNEVYSDEKKYILYCPTWRKKNRRKVTTIDWCRVMDVLPDYYELIIKLHPLESHLFEQYNQMHDRIHAFPNELTDIQELFLLSDLLITDYSSAMFDFAHLNRKIIVLQEDQNAYLNDIGWYFDLEEKTGLKPETLNEEELIERILQDESCTYNKKIINQFMNFDNAQSCQLIFDKILEEKLK